MRRWLGVLRRAVARPGLSEAAAALAYDLALSLFPALIVLNAIVGRFHLNASEALKALGPVLPRAVREALFAFTVNAARPSRALVAMALAAMLSSGAGGVRVMLGVMDGPASGGSSARRWARSLALSALLLGCAYLSFAVLFTGDRVVALLCRYLPGRWLASPALGALLMTWRLVKYPALALAALALCLAVLRAGATGGLTPGRRFVHALWAASSVAAGAAVFSRLIELSARFRLLYGSLASAAVTLTWLRGCAWLLLFCLTPVGGATAGA